LRYVGARYRIDAVDGWSMIAWLAGVIWVFGGWRLLWWSAPSVAFLWFMIPLPFRAERMLSLPLQGIATRISTWTLQLLGQPAFAQGHVICLGEHELEVAQACSGLRILVAAFALAFAYCVLIRKPWWKRIAVVLSTIPIALIANATRIVATGLLCQIVSAEAGKKFSHDVVGWIMIPLAAALFAAVLWYLDRLFPELEEVDVADLHASPRMEKEAVREDPRAGEARPRDDVPNAARGNDDGKPAVANQASCDPPAEVGGRQ
jgi:exosortase